MFFPIIFIFSIYCNLVASRVLRICRVNECQFSECRIEESVKFGEEMGELEGKKHVQYIVSVEKVSYVFIIDLFLYKAISFCIN